MRREQKAADSHGRRVEAKCGIVENNEDDPYDNNDDYNEDHVEDVELIVYSVAQTPCTRAILSYFAVMAKKSPC